MALLGANGAGKTTTLKAISNLLHAERGEVTKGSVVFEGQRIDKLSPNQVVRRGCIQVLEGRHCFGHLTIEENLLTGAFTRRDGNAAIKADLEGIYDYFPRLRQRRHSMSGYTSGGEQQMCAIGRAMMSRPKMILLDEPSMRCPVVHRQRHLVPVRRPVAGHRAPGTGIALMITIIGIPLALANFKLIPVSLAPLGKQIVKLNDPYRAADRRAERSRLRQTGRAAVAGLAQHRADLLAEHIGDQIAEVTGVGGPDLERSPVDDDPGLGRSSPRTSIPGGTNLVNGTPPSSTTSSDGSSGPSAGIIGTSSTANSIASNRPGQRSSRSATASRTARSNRSARVLDAGTSVGSSGVRRPRPRRSRRGPGPGRRPAGRPTGRKGRAGRDDRPATDARVRRLGSGSLPVMTGSV